MGHMVWLSFLFWLVREVLPPRRLPAGRLPAHGS